MMVSERLGEWEALLLWALLAQGGAAYRSQLLEKKMLPNNDAAPRERLARAGLITWQKRAGKGKGVWMEMTDKGWDAAGRSLDAPLPKTQVASPVLQAWLTRLQSFMSHRGVALADIFASSAAPDRRPSEQGESFTADIREPARYRDALRDQIRQAYLGLTDGRFNQRVLLAELREKLDHVERHSLDEALKQMHLEEGTTLSGLDNPQEITPAVRDAGLFFKGEPMYALWITR
jgi:hypothetical protein